MAYNHEKYIAQTLQSFVEQKTTFPFEIVIHDDASTDSTAQIIRQFEEKYPQLIQPIYQTENQYSKNIKVSRTYLYPRATGKYIAFCEGDDYWIDPYKLQKQVDYMESHPNCTLCFTNGQCEKNGVLSGRVLPWVNWTKKAYIPGDADYNMGQMVLLDYVPTASLLFRTAHIQAAPALSPQSFAGDTFLRLYLTSLGYAHCIDEDTCVYRFGVTGSVTTQWQQNAKKSVAFLDSMHALLDDMNAITENRYNTQIQEMKLRLDCKKLMAQRDFSSLRQKKFRKLHRSDGMAAYAKFLMHIYFPRIFLWLQAKKKGISGK